MEKPQQMGQPSDGKRCHKCNGRLLRGRANCLQCGATVPGTASSSASGSGAVNTTLFGIIGILVVAGLLFVFVTKMSDATDEVSTEITAEGVSVSTVCVAEEFHDEINQLLAQGYEEQGMQGEQVCFQRVEE